MKYYALRVVRVLKPDDKEVISLIPSEKSTVVSAVGADGYQQFYPLATDIEIAPNDVVLIEAYPRFPNFIEYRIVRIVKGKTGRELLRQLPYYLPEQGNPADSATF
jgi:hypothetical protein